MKAKDDDNELDKRRVRGRTGDASRAVPIRSVTSKEVAASNTGRLISRANFEP